MFTEEKILFVDDEPLVLAAIRRQLHGKFDIELVNSPDKALQKMKSGGQFSIVIADMTMPHMNGAQFLSEVSTLSPTSIRIVLTGNREQRVAAEAINEGKVFRFLSKPCSTDKLVTTLNEALEQHKTESIEREVLQNTLSGSVKVLTDVLQAIEPLAFSHAMTFKEDIRALAKRMGVHFNWEMALGAMLSPIGSVVLPPELLLKYHHGEPLTTSEQHLINKLPETGASLITQIPRMQNVAAIIRYQDVSFSGGANLPSGEEIPFCSRALKILKALKNLEIVGTSLEGAFRKLIEDADQYDQEILSVLFRYKKEQFAAYEDISGVSKLIPFKAEVHELKVGFLVLKDIETKDGRLLITKGNRLSEAMLGRIRSYDEYVGVKGPVLVQGTDK